MSYYMQQTTYKHDYNPGGISPRNRQTDYPYGADAPKADVPGPLNNFRPRFGDPLPQHIRDLDGQRFDEAPLTDRQRVKRGEEWIGGRRYEEPRTDRGRRYEEPRTDRGRYYEMDGQRNISPNRRYGRMYHELDNGRHTSLDRYPERGRNGSPDRHLDRGREYERPRNESPSRWDQNTYNAVDDRYEKPLQPMMDSYANQQKMADRTTYRDYGEFLQDRIKREELRKQPLEYPTANLPKSTNSGVYLFMRTHMDGKPDVVKALKEGRSVLANSYGQLKGIANNTEINLVEGLEGWNIRFNMTRTGDYWSERSQRTSGLDFIIIVFWFPSLNDAEKWVITERKFKNPHFPDPDGSDVVILPLNDSPPQERLAHTYIMTEYPRSFDPILFRDTFAPKIKDLLWRKFGIDGFFIQCIRSRYIWGSWIKPSSLVTTIRFNSKSEANAFFNDADYKQIRQDINRCIEQLPIHLNWFRPTTSMFTINEYV